MVLDVSRMFQRFKLRSSDADYLRYFYSFEKPNTDKERIKLKSFRCTTVPFGLSCSPNICTHILAMHGRKYLNGYLKNAGLQLIHSVYMDDAVFGDDTEEDLAKLTAQVKFLFSEAGLPTHKFASNSKLALEQLDAGLKCQKSTTHL